MDLRWSLDSIYPSFESEQFKGDVKWCEEKLMQMNAWVQANLQSKDGAVEKTEAMLHMLNDFLKVFSRLLRFSILSRSVDAKNEMALQSLEKMQRLKAELTPIRASFQLWVTSLENLDEVIDSAPFVKEHQFFLTNTAQIGKHILSEKEEAIIAKMNNTGAEAWSKLYQLLTATLSVELKLNGEEKVVPLTAARGMAYEKDAAKRKAAYEGELKAYEKIDESIAACLNGIKGQAIMVAKMRGYGSTLEQTLLESRMDAETLEAMLTAIRESLPAFHRFYRRKGQVLGSKNGLPFYDLFAPLGEVDMTFTYEEARKFIVKNFRTFSDKLADFVDAAFEKQWIDAEPRAGKQGGAFCHNLPMIKESRILTNFHGSFSDVATLAHELGHAYHGDCLTAETSLNATYPMPLAETASIFLETLTFKAGLKNADKAEAFVILENQITGAAQVTVDIYSRFLFESEVFKRRVDHSLSVKELKEIMSNAQKEAYGDGLDHNYLHPYMWVPKSHYYGADLHYYNYPYAFGLLFATGLYAEYLKRGERFVQELDHLLNATGKNNIADVAKIVGIDVRSADFWRSSLKIIEADIEKFIELSEEM